MCKYIYSKYWSFCRGGLMLEFYGNYLGSAYVYNFRIIHQIEDAYTDVVRLICIVCLQSPNQYWLINAQWPVYRMTFVQLYILVFFCHFVYKFGQAQAKGQLCSAFESLTLDYSVKSLSGCLWLLATISVNTVIGQHCIWTNRPI